MLTAIRDFVQEPRPAAGDAGLDMRIIKALMAIAAFIGVLEGTPLERLASVALGVAMAYVLRWWHVYPLWITIAFSAVYAFVVATSWNQYNGLLGLALSIYLLMAVYAVARWGAGFEVVVGAAVALASDLFLTSRQDLPWTDTLVLSLWALYPIGFGIAARMQARQREQSLTAARLNERHEIARELHDTVAHHVSAITIQAQAARSVAATKPETALAVLETIEEQAARTLAEMRRIVTVLRDADSEAELRPQSGLAEIASLAATDPSGPDVKVALTGALGDIGPAVQAGLYRLAQEGVTNARRHAVNATHVTVTVTGYADRIDLAVSDDGAQQSQVPSPGFGLTGLRERATQLGGTFEAGPGPMGGWVIEASIPRSTTIPPSTTIPRAT